jgi:hypothetical protein
MFPNSFLVLLGYVVGRLSHVYLNVWTGNVNWLPHHWMIGLLMMMGGYIFKGSRVRWWYWLGIGVFVSDLNDYWQLRTFEPDSEGPRRFWGID